MVFIPLKKLLPADLVDRAGINELDVCGLDEVGRGPWAGPIVACALMFKRPSHALRLPGLKDSKKLSALKRQEFFEYLERESFYGIGITNPHEVDGLGLIKANNLAFTRAIAQLASKHGRKPKFILVDGRDRLSLPHPWKTFIKGDEKIKIIACASIMAKVIRDRIMDDLAREFPAYGFASHKGYGTQAHQQALKQHGACPAHRKSFAPVHNLLQMTIE